MRLVPGHRDEGRAVAGDAKRREMFLGARQRELIERSIAPVWEANHVWLIFVLTVAWTCYPAAFGSVVSTLAIPLLIAAIGMLAFGEPATTLKLLSLGLIIAGVVGLNLAGSH